MRPIDAVWLPSRFLQRQQPRRKLVASKLRRWVALSLLCPICNTKLDSIETHEIEIDECSFCEGVWFDSGELERFYHAASVPGIKNPFRGAEFVKNNTGKVRLCPRCDSGQLLFGSVANRDVWRCEDCHGYFVFKSTISEIAPRKTSAGMVAGIEAVAGILSGLS